MRRRPGCPRTCAPPRCFGGGLLRMRRPPGSAGLVSIAYAVERERKRDRETREAIRVERIERTVAYGKRKKRR